jgi:hypothetical protein
MNYKLTIILFLFLFSFCSKKISPPSEIVDGNEKLIQNKSSNTKTPLVNICPEKGYCEVKIFKNKALSVNETGNELFYEFIDDINKTVVQYEFSKNQDKKMYDGDYKEEIVFEIDNNIKKIEFKNNELNQTKMLYGRHCFCRGSAGLFKVTDGKLILKKDKDDITFELNYNTGKIPQIISYISVKNSKLLFN